METKPTEGGFTGVVELKVMDPVVAVAMMVQCDPDLTRVSTQRVARRWVDATLQPAAVGYERHTCLRCAFLLITGFHFGARDTPDDWAAMVINRLTTPTMMITGIRLFEEKEFCPNCRRGWMP